ncbi:MAG: hypothetical protein JW712_00320 [Dehalococcoidales bacterium]|nr:hypothetical protein [Dehalococcoidales bacterium]
MRDKRYFFSIGIITVVILALGLFLRNSSVMSMSTGTAGIPEGAWFLGNSDAPVIIDMYPDFT